RENGRLPERLNPAATGNPAALARFFDLFLDQIEKHLAARGARKIKPHEPFADAEDVIMRVSQAWHDGFPVEIDRSPGFSCIFSCFLIRSDESDTPVPNSECLGMRSGVIRGVNVAVNKEQIGGRRVRLERKDRGDEEETEDGKMFHTQFGS